MAVLLDESENIAVTRPDRAREPVQTRLQTVAAWLAANPLSSSAIGMIAGIWLDSAYRICSPVALSAFLLAGWVVFACVRRRGGYVFSHVGLLLAAMAVGVLLHDLSMRRWPADHLIRWCHNGPATVQITGTILSVPQVETQQGGTHAWYPRSPRTRFVLTAEQIRTAAGPVSASGLVSVLVREPVLAVASGDRVVLVGELQAGAAARNPGTPDFSLIRSREGILVQMTCRHADQVRVEQRNASAWYGGLNRLRRWTRTAMLEDTFSGNATGSGFLAAMVLGQRTQIDPALSDAFIRSGTVHYLSVSGAHVGMLVGAIWAVGWLLGLNRRQCAGAMMIAATAYAILAEPSPPILRAAIMTDTGCLAVLVGRPMRVANWLAMSALVILVVQPPQLFNAGFQLSYLTLLSVIYTSPVLHRSAVQFYRVLRRRDDPLLSPEIQRRIGMRPRWPRLDRVRGLLVWYVSIGLSAWIVGGLLTAYHFHQVQLWGCVTSLVLVPFVWVVMVLGFLKIALTPLLSCLGPVIGWPLAVSTNVLITIVQAMARLPGSGLAAPAVPATVVVLCLVAVLIWILREPLRLSIHAVRLCLLTALITLAWAASPRQTSDMLRLEILSVGNGAATLIELPNGKTLLYDVGSYPPYDLERSAIGPLLARDHCARIDSVLLSHPNLDHYGGIWDLLARRRIGRVITTPYFAPEPDASGGAGEVIRAVQDCGIPWTCVGAEGRLTGTGDVVVEVLWPPCGKLGAGAANDTSMVVRVGYAGTRMLLCGDIEEYAIGRLVASADLKADVLLLPHHGSVVPSSAAFVRAVNPRYCIRSTGRRDTSRALAEAVGPRNYFSTARDGAISIAVDRRGLSVTGAAARP